MLKQQEESAISNLISKSKEMLASGKKIGTGILAALMMVTVMGGTGLQANSTDHLASVSAPTVKQLVVSGQEHENFASLNKDIQGKIAIDIYKTVVNSKLTMTDTIVEDARQVDLAEVMEYTLSKKDASAMEMNIFSIILEKIAEHNIVDISSAGISVTAEYDTDLINDIIQEVEQDLNKVYSQSQDITIDLELNGKVHHVLKFLDTDGVQVAQKQSTTKSI